MMSHRKWRDLALVGCCLVSTSYQVALHGNRYVKMQQRQPYMSPLRKILNSRVMLVLRGRQAEQFLLLSGHIDDYSDDAAGDAVEEQRHK